MERLTKNVSGCNQIIKCGNDLCKETCEEWSCDFCPISEAIDKLADYEDAEEQGLLLRLPCKVGDTVYVISPNYNKCENHYECDDYDPDSYLIIWCQKYCEKGFSGIGIIECAVTKIEIRENDLYFQTDKCGMRNIDNIFLTKEEAEQALKNMQGV